MPRPINAYKVFIASPKDVVEERDVVRKVCEELNRDPLVIRENIQFAATGWEDVVPSAERPQQIINRELKDYDIFVCMFHRRFGMPSGREESGTLEEFRQAYESWEEIEKPHILLYFKKVRDLEKEAENDPQLQSVVRFRNRIDRENLLFYGEFESPSEFRTMFTRQMRSWIRDNVPAVDLSVEPGVVSQQATGEAAASLDSGIETIAGRMAEEKFQLLHISDLHITTAENFDRSVVLDSLITRVKEDRNKGLKPEIVVVTGDVAATGIAEEYEQAKEFLDKLAGALELSRERFFIVPGNHDVNRKRYRKSDVPAYENMRELNEELENSDFREDLLRGMNDYFGFIGKRYPHLKSGSGKLVPFVNTHIAGSGRRVALVGLNSSWMCRKSPDEKEIAVGEYQVKKAMEELKKRGEHDLVINLLHHPLAWLWPEDGKILRRYLNNAMTLSGHLHHAAGGHIMDMEGNSFLLQAGGAYLGSESDWPARYQYITVDWAEGAIQVDFRKFAGEKRIWTLDGETGEDGKMVFRNTGIIKIAQKEMGKGSIPKPPSPLPALPAGYLEWLRGNCAYMDVDNLQGKGSPISISLPEIFIPLLAVDPESAGSVDPDMGGLQNADVEKEPGKSDVDPKGFAEATEAGEFLLQRLGRMHRADIKIDLEELIGRYDSLLVEGHPGSGKSTLFKHIAYCLAGGENVGGIENYLPVLIPLKDLKGYFDDIANGVLVDASVESILKYWLKNKTELLSVETIIEFCKAKKILFLIDGLDEIGQKERDRVADAFYLFRVKFPGIKIVFAGRPHGIRGEVLKKFGKPHVKIENLALEQIEDFIGRWFASIYSRSTVAAEQTARSMIGEIRAHQGIEKFVDNPLMLTAICILYHDGKKLPNQRAELYKKFMDHLIYSRFDQAEPVYDFLKKLAFQMHERGERGIGRRDALEVLKSIYTIREKEKELSYRHRIESIFDKIEPRCGLLKRESGEFLFWHLTFQEFLTALHIVDNHMDYIEAIKGYWDRENFREVIKLFIGYLSIENRNWANGIVKNAVDRKKKNLPKIILASSALLDIQENRRDETTAVETRKSLVSVIELAPEPEMIVEAGENLGRLKDHRDLKEFVKIRGGEYDLEGLGKTLITPFELGKYPVTNGWFGEFIEDGGYKNPRLWSREGQKWLREEKVKRPVYWNERKWNCPNAPVVGVCWYEADAFARWLSAVAQDDYTYRLPSEKEWQAAAAGLSKRAFPWGKEWNRKFCNSEESKIGKNSPVGIFREGDTPEGVSDLAGNVWEWTQSDYYRGEVFQDYKAGSEDIEIGSRPVLRGGSWFSVSVLCRCAVRLSVHPVSRDDDTGFRCART